MGEGLVFWKRIVIWEEVVLRIWMGSGIWGLVLVFRCYVVFGRLLFVFWFSFILLGGIIVISVLLLYWVVVIFREGL